MDPGGSDLESSLSQAENPCLIVEDSQPDSVALEDDPDTSYRTLLARRLSNLQPASHSPVLELITSPSTNKCRESEDNTSAAQTDFQLHQTSSEHSQVLDLCAPPNKIRSTQEDMESGADSTTSHCPQTEEGTSQFGLLELSESQGVYDGTQTQKFGAEELQHTAANLQSSNQKASEQTGLKNSFKAPDNRDESSKRSEVSSSSSSVSQSGDGRELSIQAILHSQVSGSLQAEDDEMMSSQEDLFDRDRNGSKVDSTGAELDNQHNTATPAHSLRLLHLSGQGTLVQESLSQQSVDFVAATQENLSQTPLIVPSSPTEHDNEPDSLEADKCPKDTSDDPPPVSVQDEPIAVEPAPKTTTSTPSQNLSLPTQPEFSHDVFVPTPSCSQNSDRRKEAPIGGLAATLDAGTFKKAAGSQPSEALTSLQLELESESSVFEKKTQVFAVEEDSQATQIDDIPGRDGVSQTDSVHTKADQNKVNSEFKISAPSQELSPKQDPKMENKEINSNLQTESEDVSISGDQCIPNSVESEWKGVVNKEQTFSSTSQGNGEPKTPSTVQSPSVKPSQPASEKASEDEAGGKLSPPMSQSHRLDVMNSSKDLEVEEGDVQSTSRTEGSGLGLALSQSQLESPEPMEVTEDGSTDRHKEDSYSVLVLEESQRVSQEKGPKPNKSSSQPVFGSPKEKQESGKNMPDSQPKENAKARNDSDAASQSGGVANKSLSDSSGELPFHFTLPKEGELIGPPVSSTPPYIRQLKNTPLHSTPIETGTYREREDAGVTTETTMAASEISVEDSGESADRSDGKLSLRMKVVTPVHEDNSEHFSLKKPSFSDEEGSVVKATTVAKAVTSTPSIFSQVRELHKQVDAEEEQERRPPSETAAEASHNRPMETLGNGTVKQLPQQANSTTAPSEPAAPSGGKESEAPSFSEQAGRTSPSLRAESQQSATDLPAAATANPLRKQRAVSQQTSFEVSGSKLSMDKGEPVTPTRSHLGPSHRRHVRTIQEVRTTITRIITDVFYEDGREVDRKVVEESEEPVVDRCVLDNDISPSRTGSSMTSGDLADVSSLSSKAASHFSSSGTSSGGPAISRMADFVMPSSRGAKSGSPRKGSRPAVGSKLTGGWAISTVAPPSPNGNGRRGRPPSRSPLHRGGRSGQRGGGGGVPGQVMSSSEEDPLAHPNARVPSTCTDSLNTTSSENSAGISSFIGMRVMAKWSSNSFFYSGSITHDLGENRFRLLFDDNQECEVQGKDILLCDPIPLETEVTALTEEEFFNTGLVKGHKHQGAELLYSVERDGQSVWYSRTAVILTMDQGNRLREQYGLGPYEPPTPQNMASDISLDNLVEGKRRRRGNTPAPGTPTSSATNSPRTPGKRKLTSSTDDERTPAKRGRRGGGHRAGSRVATCNTSGSGADLPGNPDDLLTSHGPIPENASLFMGFVFMLTASSEKDRDDSNQVTSDGDEEYVQTAPYNKQYTERQLEAGGGMILSQFNEEQCKAAYQSLLIADQHCRTRTYLLCVAGGVPCISQIWVRDCCQEQKLMNYRNYLLPAGLGPEHRMVEWHPRCNPFKALRVLLMAEERLDLWRTLLTMCGAREVQQCQANSSASDLTTEQFDVLVSGSRCPAELLRCLMEAGIPVVSVEWLVQCVISGERLAYDGQPEYQHHDHS